jgi:hypothetical protein
VVAAIQVCGRRGRRGEDRTAWQDLAEGTGVRWPRWWRGAAVVDRGGERSRRTTSLCTTRRQPQLEGAAQIQGVSGLEVVERSSGGGRADRERQRGEPVRRRRWWGEAAVTGTGVSSCDWVLRMRMRR